MAGRNFLCPNSRRSAAFVLHFALLFVGVFPNSVLSLLRYYVCTNVTVNDSRYSYNLNRVVDDLFRNTPPTGFNTSSRGHGSNQVYGLLQCWGNVSPAGCASCSQEANDRARELCPNNMGAQVWTDRCYLRYGNSNFISKLDTSGGTVSNSQEITTHLSAFEKAAATLMSNLCHKASDPATKGFAMGSLNYTATNKVYTRVQCLRDISLQDCRSCLSIALKNVEQCCYTKQGAQILLGSCTVRYEIYPFYNSSGSSSSPGITSAVNPLGAPPSNRKHPKHLPLILGVLGAVVLVLAASLFAVHREVRSAISRRLITLFRQNEEICSPDRESLKHERSHIFRLKALREATENFHDRNKLGQGGFGPVYKGNLNGNEVAVKKLSAISKQGKIEFMNEVKLVANIQHRNLVRLLGCCAEGAERLLVYEYLQNNSLDAFIFDPDPEKLGHLDWQKRYNIIIGIARGLLYLHEDSQLRIIHRDIKANNILLDENLNPKISDFGLARLFPDNETFVQTRVAGTYGYMAPEYAMLGHLSLKADIYSFGVLLLEIVSGRRNTDTNLPLEGQSLLEWAWGLYKAGNILNIVDATARESCSEEEAIRCIYVGLLCVQSDATLRPNISNVITMMSSDSVVLPNPTKPAFVSVRKKHGSTSKSSSTSRLQEYKYEKEATSATTCTTTGSSTLSYDNVNMSLSLDGDPITELQPR